MSAPGWALVCAALCLALGLPSWPWVWAHVQRQAPRPPDWCVVMAWAAVAAWIGMVASLASQAPG